MPKGVKNVSEPIDLGITPDQLKNMTVGQLAAKRDERIQSETVKAREALAALKTANAEKFAALQAKVAAFPSESEKAEKRAEAAIAAVSTRVQRQFDLLTASL